MAQGQFLGATTSVSELGCCNAIALATATMIGIQKFSPLLAYSRIIELDAKTNMGNGSCLPFTATETKIPALRQIDPHKETHHIPDQTDITQRIGSLNAFGLYKIEHEITKACCPTGYMPNVLGNYISYMTKLVISLVSRKVDEIFFSAFNADIIEAGSSTIQLRPYSKSCPNNSKSLAEDGVVTYDASTSSLTYQAVQKIKALLARKQNLQHRVLFIVPPDSLANFTVDAKVSQVMTEQMYFDGRPTIHVSGSDFYTTYDPEFFFKPENGVVVEGGSTVDDVVLGYAMPMDSMLFAYVNHDIPPINGITTNNLMPNPMMQESTFPGSSATEYITSVTGSEMPTTNIFKAEIDKNPAPNMMGLNTRVEAMMGAIRARRSAIVRIALPKADIGL